MSSNTEVPLTNPLIAYNSLWELYPCGFRNLGATCYFNTLIQAMMSCTSFTEELMKRKTYVFDNNPIINLLIEFIETNVYYEDLCQKLINNDPDIVVLIAETKKKLQNYSPQIWQQMNIMLCKKKQIPLRSFMQGQQCVGEGYHYLLETMEDYQPIQNLFLHRYKSLIHCFDCEKWVSNVDCMYSLFEVEPDLKTAQIEKFRQYHVDAINMNEFLTKQSGYVDENYVCPQCKKTGEKYRMNILAMVPEILVIMAKKYNVDQKKNILTDFPDKLEFNGNAGSKMMYEAVAQIEHSGGKHGGHYWAICRRKNGWFNINDTNITPSQFQPTKNTYIVFYHLV